MNVSSKILNSLETLVAFPTFKEEGMRGCASHIRDELQRAGFHASIDPVQNVFAEKEFEGDGHGSFLINTHFDTVSDNERWTREPFRVTLEGDRAYGLGTSDAKGGIACTIAALEQLKESKFKRIIVLFSNYEDNNVLYEGRKWLGTEFFLTRQKLAADYGINVEGTVEHDRFLISVGCGGRVGFDITTLGIEAHSSDPRKGRNAIYDMVKVIEALRRLPPATMKIDGCEVYAEANVSVIHGGTAINVVPGTCKIECERRVLPHETWDAVKKTVDEALGSVKDVNLKVEFRRAQHPYYLDPSHEAVALGREAVEAVTGHVPSLKVEAGRTDSTYIHELAGVKTIILGPGEVAHIPDEYVSLARLNEFSQILAKMLA